MSKFKSELNTHVITDLSNVIVNFMTANTDFMKKHYSDYVLVQLLKKTYEMNNVVFHHYPDWG